ncbi:uncharacterized protein EI90DRAFT_2907177, partial [Cantharellus anzutake]|uniref:uncharacterized protein n=1 Tax=Cantharellus anzutake TaxID=1750568 RepID=UPI00190592CC
IRVPFLTADHALIAKRAIEVDPERQPHLAKRTLTVEGNVLVAKFSLMTVRLARLVSNSFLESVELVARTLEAFGDDAEASKSNI